MADEKRRDEKTNHRKPPRPVREDPSDPGTYLNMIEDPAEPGFYLIGDK